MKFFKYLISSAFAVLFPVMLSAGDINKNIEYCSDCDIEVVVRSKSYNCGKFTEEGFMKLCNENHDLKVDILKLCYENHNLKDDTLFLRRDLSKCRDSIAVLSDSINILKNQLQNKK